MENINIKWINVLFISSNMKQIDTKWMISTLCLNFILVSIDIIFIR